MVIEATVGDLLQSSPCQTGTSHARPCAAGPNLNLPCTANAQANQIFPLFVFFSAAEAALAKPCRITSCGAMTSLTGPW